jgi:hypothetical protein
MKKVHLEYSSVMVNLPSIDFFLEKIQKNEPFHFLRANHGIWDLIFFTFQNNTNELYSLIDSKNYFEIAKRVVDYHTHNKFYKDREGIKYFHGESKYLVNRLHYFVLTFCEYKSLSTKFEIGISLGVGLHDRFGVLANTNHIQLGREQIAKIFTFKNDMNTFHYSGVFKHYCIMREIKILFDKLNELNFNVIFLGQSYFKKFETIYNINNFNHIEIPIKNASDPFDTYIELIRDINFNNKKTIVFHSCGHILSFYLAHQLKDTNIFGIDMGKSFDLDAANYVEQERLDGKYDWFNASWIPNPTQYYSGYINELRK